VLPDIRLTLLEATGKKTKFLQHLVETLALSKVLVVTGRAEEVGHQVEHRQQYQVAVARAVSKLAVLVEYALPLVKLGGLVIAQKGQDPADEVKASATALHILGGKIKEVIPVDIPGLDASRHLVVIQKIKPTPKQYPRRSGMPAKEPL
jgi:16S rRNA (guanine527-N7)-methyltransferase